MQGTPASPAHMDGRIFSYGTPTLTAAQVRRLAEKVRCRLGSIGDPAIRAPLPCDYLAERHFSPCNYFDLAVDIDIGPTVLTLRSSANWPNKPELGPGSDLDAIAEAIMTIVVLARGDNSGLARLHAIEKVIRTKIRRDGLGLELASVRFGPAPIYHPDRASELGTWVRVVLLDDLLLPYTQVIAEQGNRRICRQLKHHDGDQARRRQVLARLASQGAVIEIDASAEHAIAVAGLTAGEVVRTMFKLRKPGRGDGRTVTLWGNRGTEHVSVVAHGGCIKVEARLGDFEWTCIHGIVVGRVFPETITMALVGRRLRALIEHPFLLGDAEIAEASCCGGPWTDIQIKADVRPIRQSEIDG